MGNRSNPSESSASPVSIHQILSLYSVNPQPPQQHPALLTSYRPTVSSASSVSARTHAKSCKLTHSHTRQGLRTEESPWKKKKKKRENRAQNLNPETHKSVRCSWTLWQIYLGQIVSEKLPLELPWTKLAVGESKSRCMRVGDNGGRMCWCAAGGWGGTMDGLVSPLADWFEMAPLSLSPWGVPLSRFWFPLLTNSKQKSISFSREGGREYGPVFQLGKVTQKLICQRWLTL